MVYSKIKRVICLLMSVMILIQTPMLSFADSGSLNSGWTQSRPQSGNSDGTGNKAKMPGYRITMGVASTFGTDGISKLEGSYTKTDLTEQYTKMVNTATKRWFEPCTGGLNFAEHYVDDIHVRMHEMSSTTAAGYYNEMGRVRLIKGTGADSSGTQNKLGYFVYNTPEGLERQAGAVDYNETLYEAVVKGRANYGTVDDWLYDIRKQYRVALGVGEGGNDGNTELMENVLFCGISNLPQSIDNFSWASNVFNSTSDNGPLLANWSFLGYLTMLIQITWYAQDNGNLDTYNNFADKLDAWASSGWNADMMPILLAEATTAVTASGTSQSLYDTNTDWVMANIPWLLTSVYGNSSYAERLYSGWEDEKTNTDDILANILSDAVSTLGASRLARLTGHWWEKGTVKGNDGLAYAKAMHPARVSGADYPNLYGYNFFFTYYIDNPTPEVVTPKNDKTNAKGSFTWVLDPHGVYDVSPETEVNRSSTITNLNISQSGYNYNNYTDWEKYVASYGNDCNRIRINIYRISETLPDDKAATLYTRDQVKARGKTVVEAVDRVTLGNGYITGWPKDSGITQLYNGQMSDKLTNAQFLTIMKEATGLSYNETVAGPLTESGVRVTYAVYVDYSVGNCSSATWQPLSNDQTAAA